MCYSPYKRKNSGKLQGPVRHDRFSSNMTNEYDWAQDTAPSRQSDLTALRVNTLPACPSS